MKTGILIISPTFHPDIGGVETHLNDLIAELSKKEDFEVFVCTHKPIVTHGIKKYIRKEKVGNNVTIYRFWWIGFGLFHILEKYPLLQFLYLVPYLFFRTFLFMLFRHKKIQVIHANGFSSSLIGLWLKKIFHKKLITSTHAVYEIDKNSSTAKRIQKILDESDKILTLSDASFNELVSFGLEKEKLDRFKYWIDLDTFCPLDKARIRKELNIQDRFTVLFVGRLLKKKGIRVFIEVAKLLPQVQFVVIGVGPEEEFINSQLHSTQNLIFLGAVPNIELSRYYNIADVFCIPSLYEEGFGRVVMEAVACGLPVVGSNKGGIKEALDESVSILVEPTVDNIAREIESLYKNEKLFLAKKENCRLYAEKNFSSKNIEYIVNQYYLF